MNHPGHQLQMSRSRQIDLPHLGIEGGANHALDGMTCANLLASSWVTVNPVTYPWSHLPTGPNPSRTMHREFVQVTLRGGQMGMTHHPLHIGQRHLQVGHPVRRGMPQIVQRSVRPQRGVGSGEHRPCRVIAQRPKRAPQRPPQRLVPPGRHQTDQLRLIQP